jgi:putative oxidoreductase
MLTIETTKNNMSRKILISRIMAVIAALVLLQTLYFKFTAHPDSVYIFSQLGVEPWGRIILGILELITGILLLIPRTTLIGALVGLGLITGALFSHIFMLGIVVNDDGGQLFMLALLVFVSCLLVIVLRTDELQALKSKFIG